MPRVEVEKSGESTQYFLGGRVLSNGDEVMVRLGGLGGWATVTIVGLPDTLKVRYQAADGKEVVTSLPIHNTDLRWP